MKFHRLFKAIAVRIDTKKEGKSRFRFSGKTPDVKSGGCAYQHNFSTVQAWKRRHF